MQTLDGLVADLGDRYTGDEQHPGDGGPGLIARLDSLALRTRQPPAGGHAPPGSRPPTSLDAVHWSTAIKAQARILDMELRGSTHMQQWDRALRAIPYGAEATGRVGEVTSTVGGWHSACRTVLGLQAPAREMRHVRCLVCGQASIKSRPDSDRPRAWCTNPACVDEDTGRPARYEGGRLYLLTTNITHGHPA
ncbi:hypothetical protein ACFY1J_31075 [Streptomyces sp. NPDC001406]|uniref:DUF7341 domain-containing protein n=1 Tax=Streptomyces sp. NPDC001406 TaxID=3364572 RepID=UPI00369FCACB